MEMDSDFEMEGSMIRKGGEDDGSNCASKRLRMMNAQKSEHFLKGAKSITMPERRRLLDTSSVSSQCNSKMGSGKLQKKKILDYWKGNSHGIKKDREKTI